MMATATVRRGQSARSVQSLSSSVGDKSTNTKSTAKPVSLARRLLFPNVPADTDLPPLLVSPSAEPTLNAELYDFIALALRAFVNPWWTKITRYDKEFLPTITRILTVVIRALEARLVATDLSPLVFRDLPALFTQHTVDFRNAQSKLHTSYASGGAATLPQLFHQLQPHMAISANGRIDEVYIRQAVDYILKECLPYEDYDPETERYIVREILVKVVLGNVVPKLTEPWFIHKLMLDILGPEKGKPSESSKNSVSSVPRPAFSFQSFTIFVLSAIQSVSGVCLALMHAYRQARDTIKKVNESPPRFLQSPGPRPPPAPKDAPATPLPATASSEVPSALAPPPSDSPATPSRPRARPISPGVSATPLSRTTSSTSTASLSTPFATTLSPPPPPPDYTTPLLALTLTLLTPPPHAATSATASAPGASARSTALALAHTLSLPLTALAPFLSRLLPYLLYTHALSAARITDIVRIARRALFPDGWPAPPPPDPPPEEQAAMRQELGRRLLAAIPGPIALLLGPTPLARTHTIDGLLGPFSSRECNAHLILFILDLILLTVFPEMGVSVTDAGDSVVPEPPS